MTDINDQTRNGDILEIFGCKMLSKKLLELNETSETLPTASGLKVVFKDSNVHILVLQDLQGKK